VLPLAFTTRTSVNAQTTPAAQRWAFAAIGVGGNAINDPSNRLKGTPQGFLQAGAVRGRGQWGLQLDGFFAREVDRFVGDCVGFSPPSCYASGFNLVGSSVALVLPLGRSLTLGSSAISAGVGGYHTPRTYSRNGNLPSQTTIGLHAGLEGWLWRSPTHAVTVSGRASFLPSVHQRRAWAVYVATSLRAGF
jgi:hypothetical protein